MAGTCKANVTLKSIGVASWGGGNKETTAQNHHINLGTNLVPTTATINWPMLAQYQMVVAIPQGQACNGIVNAWNPNGVNTVTGVNPLGVATWSNWDMWSQADDVQMLIDLSAYLTKTYKVTDNYLMGHSNGGFMTKRMWYESPTTFTHYCCFAGPASNHYYQSGLVPATVQPLFCIVGGCDTVLDTSNGPMGTGDHFQDPLWEGQNAQLSVACLSYPSLPQRVGEWVQFSTVSIPAMGDQPMTFNQGTTTPVYSGTHTSWASSSGKLALHYVSDANHPIASMEQCLQQQLIQMALQFCMTT